MNSFSGEMNNGPLTNPVDNERVNFLKPIYAHQSFTNVEDPKERSKEISQMNNGEDNLSLQRAEQKDNAFSDQIEKDTEGKTGTLSLEERENGIALDKYQDDLLAKEDQNGKAVQPNPFRQEVEEQEEEKEQKAGGGTIEYYQAFGIQGNQYKLIKLAKFI